jgi:hypothetical protein
MKNYGKENKINIEDEQNVHNFHIMYLFQIIEIKKNEIQINDLHTIKNSYFE